MVELLTKHSSKIKKSQEECSTTLKNMDSHISTGTWYLEDFGEEEKDLKSTFELKY
jgi:hypothetical protein